MKFVIKLFPEIIIKSKPVRKRFIVQLRRNIKNTFDHFGIDCHVRGLWDSMEMVIRDDSQEMAARKQLMCIPGITKILTVKEYNFETFDDIFAIAKKNYAEAIKDKTFSVRVKRTGKHDFQSVDVERYVGGGLLQHCEAKSVDLKNPEYTVRLEIRKQRLHTVAAVDEGTGGYPLGSQDGVLSLISGGFDSNVASYLMARRGLQTHFLFFNLGGSAHEIGVKQMAHYLWETYAVSHGVKFVTVPFEGVVRELLENVDNAQMGVILKRMMLRVGSHIAKDLGIEAMVTGESLYQVSSQTLRNLTVIDSVTDMLVLRPLIAMDKPDIIDLARKIGIYDLAANMPEYCGAMSVNPTTRAKPEKIKEEESKFDFTVLDEAIAGMTLERIKHVLTSTESLADVELVAVPMSNDLIVDIRLPQEQEKSPLHLTGNDIIKIPFYKLSNELSQLPKDRNILLYCARGTMSQVHAQQLKQAGLENVKVFKP